MTYHLNILIPLQFHEPLEIRTGNSILHLTLAGKGVSPLIDLNMPMEMGVLDMGAVLAGGIYREDIQGG